MPPKRRYDEIAAHFRRQIQDGELSPGDKLPSLRKVCDDFGTSMNTANRAFQMLKAEGLTTATLEGTVVASRPNVVISGLDRLERLNRTGRRYAPGEDSTDLRVMRRSARDADVCQALEIDPSDEVLIRIRTFRQDGRPTSIGISVYLPRTTNEVPELEEEERMDRPFDHIYAERTGREVTPGQRTARARQASQDEIDALQLDVPAHMAVAVLVTNVTFHDEEGPLAYWEDVYAPGERIPVA